MDLYPKDEFIGVFDSGSGGVSVLKELCVKLPHENFVYVADSLHAPYGSKSDDEVLEYSCSIAKDFFDRGAKALVVACNTATSASVAHLRDIHKDRIIVGSEPALKPAVKDPRNTRILVMGTGVTLRREKYCKLLQRFSGVEGVEIYSCPCPGLAERIDAENLEAPDVRELLENLIGSYAGKVNAVVLGCTHYPFIKKQIAAVLGPYVSSDKDVQTLRFYDGALGCARRLSQLLGERELLCGMENRGAVRFFNTSQDQEELARYRRFFSREIWQTD